MASFWDRAKKTLHRARKDAVEIAKKRAQIVFPFLADLKEGRIVIPQSFIESQVKERIRQNGDIESVSIQCLDGYFLVTAHVKKTALLVVPSRFIVTAKVTVTAFRIGKEAQIIKLRVLDDVDVQGQDFLGRIASWIGCSLIEEMAQSDDTAAKMLKHTKGLVDIAWPEVTIHPAAHPVIQRINGVGFNVGDWNIGVWDFMEFDGCAIEPGQVVLNMKTLPIED